MSHPIYQYLPSTFKNELSKVLSDNYSLRDNPMFPLINNSKVDPKANGDLDNQSDEKMLEYLRY